MECKEYNRCILCNSKNLSPVKGPDKKSYFKCQACTLIFASKENMPSLAEEKIRYKLHENSLHDLGYVRFLSQAIEPALLFLEEGCSVLDYGCGPATILLNILKQKIDCKTTAWDPIFFPNVKLEGPYDAIFSTEVFEHFHNPALELKHLYHLLNPGGILIIMTEWIPHSTSFDKWYYPRDPTHVCFWSNESFQWVEKEWSWKRLYSDDKRVIILKK